MAIVMFLASYKLVLWGSLDKLFTDNSESFLGLIQMLGKYDEVILKDLQRVPSKDCNNQYCRKTIQDELITPWPTKG